MKRFIQTFGQVMVVIAVTISLITVMIGMFPLQTTLYFEEFRAWLYGGAVHADHVSMLTIPARVLIVGIGVVGIIVAFARRK